MENKGASNNNKCPQGGAAVSVSPQNPGYCLLLAGSAAGVREPRHLQPAAAKIGWRIAETVAPKLEMSAVYVIGRSRWNSVL